MEVHAMRQARLLDLLKGYETDREFAEAAGLVPAHVSQMKNGTRTMGDAVARRIEENLNLPFGWMDGKEGLDLTKEERELLSGYRSADPAIRAAARRLLVVEEKSSHAPSKRTTLTEEHGKKGR